MSRNILFDFSVCQTQKRLRNTDPKGNQNFFFSTRFPFENQFFTFYASLGMFTNYVMLQNFHNFPFWASFEGLFNSLIWIKLWWKSRQITLKPLKNYTFSKITANFQFSPIIKNPLIKYLPAINYIQSSAFLICNQ